MKKYTLITGATSGIGRALAYACAKRGQNLIIASRSTEKMLAIKKELEQKYAIEVKTITVDLSQPEGPQFLIHQCANSEINILINNSGVGLGAVPQVDHPLADSNNLLQINVLSLVTLSTVLGKKMKERRDGYIMNIASTAAFQPMPYAALYGASKAFVLSFSEAMALELNDYNVGVTAVCPGITDTNFFKHGKPNIPSWVYKLISPELVAERGLEAMYKKKIYVVPYFQHWIVAQLHRFLPRHTAASIMKKVEKVRKRI
jgi:short-subunit dehydrogenase